MYKCKNCTVENNRLLNNSIGIYLRNSDYNLILGNLIGRGEKGNDSNSLTITRFQTIELQKTGMEFISRILKEMFSQIIRFRKTKITESYFRLQSATPSQEMRLPIMEEASTWAILTAIRSRTIRLFQTRFMGFLFVPKSDRNQVFNNYFNNTVNAIANNGTDNSYNMKKTAGTNIVGGPYLAGNFWARPDWHSGHSEITPDSDGDGIADKKYRLEKQRLC